MDFCTWMKANEHKIKLQKRKNKYHALTSSNERIDQNSNIWSEWYTNMSDRYIQENHEKSKSGTMHWQLWQKRCWGGLPCWARVAAPPSHWIKITWDTPGFGKYLEPHLEDVQCAYLDLKSCLRLFVLAKDDIWWRLRQKSKRPKQCHDMWNIDFSSFKEIIFVLLTNHFNEHVIVNRNQILTRNPSVFDTWL